LGSTVACTRRPAPAAAPDVLQSKRLVIESRWLSKVLSLAGHLRPRRQQLAVLTHLLVTVPGACVGCLLRSLPQMYCRQGDHKNLLIELNQILDGFSYHHRVISTAICILT
jgi:hypothetical protein